MVLCHCTWWVLFSHLFVCLRQPVYVGATWEHQETLHLPVGGFHQLLRPSLQTHGLHDRWDTPQSCISHPWRISTWFERLIYVCFSASFSCTYFLGARLPDRWTEYHPLDFSLFFFPVPGVYGGIKFFIIDFLFKSCPKLRDKYDTPYIVWNSLPTDPQLKERINATVSRRVREQQHTPAIKPRA